MYKQNIEAVERRVGDQRGVCGVWRCQICKNGTLYYEVYKDGSMNGRCTNRECAEWMDDEKTEMYLLLEKRSEHR